MGFLSNTEYITLRQSDIIADMHTHTIYSKHAFSTLKENLDAAIMNGMKYIACTDHCYANTLTTIGEKNELARLSLINRVNPYHGTTVISSMEFNLTKGYCASIRHVCMREVIKYKPFGLHSWFYNIPNMEVDDLMKLFAYATKTYRCNAFAHIEREIDKMSHGKYKHMEGVPDEVKTVLRKIVEYAKAHDILLEVNESSIKDDGCGNYDRMRYWLSLAKDNGNRIVLGSDAHFCEEVGVFTNSIALLNELQYPRELIINCNEDEIKKFVV